MFNILTFENFVQSNSVNCSSADYPARNMSRDRSCRTHSVNQYIRSSIRDLTWWKHTELPNNCTGGQKVQSLSN